jgi:hypothetical protein
MDRLKNQRIAKSEAEEAYFKQEEKRLHLKYASFQVQGEWFQLTPEQVAEICAIEGEAK